MSEPSQTPLPALDVQRVAAQPGQPGLFLALAPMDGVTDWVHRRLATEYAGERSPVSLCVSEFVRVTGRQVTDRVLLRHCPELAEGGRTASGVPVFVQLLGSDLDSMARTAERAVRLGAPGVDLNFGCPAKRVNQHDGGAALLKAPERVEQVTRAVVQAVGGAAPVTVKIRLGWEDAGSVCTLARAAEQAGAAWLTIHARTRLQMYAPGVDWDSVGRAARAVSMPVVANGDVFGSASLAECRERAATDAFMLGRGALADPAVFGSLRGEAAPPGLDTYAAWILRYADYLGASGLPQERVLRRVKQWLGLAASVRPAHVTCFDVIKRMSSWETARAKLIAEREIARNRVRAA